ncbi:hypothetical protein BD779DRAFT_1476899 [Infundibulicybe gibba]|nr:hypothetical protein BD779DRAFT_1476899 [Infundibulicybe gibba]
MYVLHSGSPLKGFCALSPFTNKTGYCFFIFYGSRYDGGCNATELIIKESGRKKTKASSVRILIYWFLQVGQTSRRFDTNGLKAENVELQAENPKFQKRAEMLEYDAVAAKAGLGTVVGNRVAIDKTRPRVLLDFGQHRLAGAMSTLRGPRADISPKWKIIGNQP